MKYNLLFKLSIALTNAHILWNLFCVSDGAFYSTVASRLVFIGDLLINKRSPTQDDSCLHRRARLSSQLSNANSIDEFEKSIQFLDFFFDFFW